MRIHNVCQQTVAAVVDWIWIMHFRAIHIDTNTYLPADCYSIFWLDWRNNRNFHWRFCLRLLLAFSLFWPWCHHFWPLPEFYPSNNDELHGTFAATGCANPYFCKEKSSIEGNTVKKCPKTFFQSSRAETPLVRTLFIHYSLTQDSSDSWEVEGWGRPFTGK